MQDKILDYFNESRTALDELKNLSEKVEEAVGILKKVFLSGGRVLLFGCGGSAADAQHIATELLASFRKERAPLPAISLTTNTSLITAVSNDFDFKDVFKRQIEAFGCKKDAAFAISTSGNSSSVVNAARTAGEKGLKVISMTGRDGGELKKFSDLNLNVPASQTSHIQECHIIVAHTICSIIEEELF